MSYNGFRNWETWVFMLYFEEYLHETLQEYEKIDYQTVYDTVEAFIDEMHNSVDDEKIGSAFLNDLLNASLDSIDIHEVTETLIEDLKEN